ncbi:MAG: nucleotide sugar dehydrogenase, partial [Elusimicrobia bacterium]|nr:nucleotide sugar dehydrogenase [Elusimicrobiota bacterium]
MNLVIIGSGYVGLVTAACFADFGHNVTCVDIDSKKVKSLQNGIIPIFEPGLEALVKTNLEKKYLRFTTDLGEALKNCHVVFIAVGTPACQDGKTDMKYMWNAAAEIGSKMQGDIRIVNKSTVPVGSADKTRQIISEELKKRDKSFNFSVLSIPEFLKEGTAIEDCMRPARIIIGADCEKDVIFMKKLYKPFILQAENIIVMDIKSAEMTKYAANSMLAAKISFINEIAAICEKNGANIQSVRKGIGSDPRIGYH